MPKPTKRSCLEPLTRARLLELTSAFEVEVSKRARHAVLVDALMAKRSAKLAEILPGLSRDELKDICDRHGLDRKGRAKAPIIERILGRGSASETKRTPKPKPRKATRTAKAAPPAPSPAQAVQAELPLGEDEQPEQVDLAKLGSHLWEAANILRGSPVDRTDWKSYILPLLFFKRICDVWTEQRKEI